MTTLDTIAARLKNYPSDLPGAWTELKVLVTRLAAERRDGTLLDELQHEHDRIAEQRLLRAIRRTVSDTGNDGADYVLFLTGPEEDDFYLVDFAEIATTARDCHTAEVSFGAHVDDLLATRFPHVGPDSALGVHLATGTFVIKRDIDAVREDMAQLSLSRTEPAEDPEAPAAADQNTLAVSPQQDCEPFTGQTVLDAMLAADPRVFAVIASFVAQRLSLHDVDDRVESVIPLILDRMSAGSYVVAAARLLENLDAMEIRGLGGRDPLVRPIREAVRRGLTESA